RKVKVPRQDLLAHPPLPPLLVEMLIREQAKDELASFPDIPGDLRDVRSLCAKARIAVNHVIARHALTERAQVCQSRINPDGVIEERVQCMNLLQSPPTLDEKAFQEFLHGLLKEKPGALSIAVSEQHV
ncbi:MAG TPA: hypothetical protein VJO34_16635, partial [Methylomirabilota bacterium]|nr:hypothetical protein [Methylomirabilota bacterium]